MSEKVLVEELDRTVKHLNRIIKEAYDFGYKVEIDNSVNRGLNRKDFLKQFTIELYKKAG
jgi:hypothetical protein